MAFTDGDELDDRHYSAPYNLRARLTGILGRIMIAKNRKEGGLIGLFPSKRRIERRNDMAEDIKILTEKQPNGSWSQTVTPNGEVQLFGPERIGEMIKQHNDLVMANTESTETNEATNP